MRGSGSAPVQGWEVPVYSESSKPHHSNQDCDRAISARVKEPRLEVGQHSQHSVTPAPAAGPFICCLFVVRPPFLLLWRLRGSVMFKESGRGLPLAGASEVLCPASSGPN